MDLVYEKELAWYRNQLSRLAMRGNLNDHESDYYSYLKRWFSDGPCDGAPNYSARYAWNRLPMSYNEYMWG